jgi:hypothetical protein
MCQSRSTFVQISRHDLESSFDLVVVLLSRHLNGEGR